MVSAIRNLAHLTRVMQEYYAMSTLIFNYDITIYGFPTFDIEGVEPR